ncbi:MAG: efflux RND transporter periplasmic adaptor subunit [Gammaproteobacteria bacterium]|nr:efflux RND transporter periplasmic adaptor subunit [Gammaproteobacteria bacterium]
MKQTLGLLLGGQRHLAAAPRLARWRIRVANSRGDREAVASPSDSSGSASGKPKRRWVGTTQVVVVVALVLLALVYARVPDDNGDAQLRIGAAESPKPLVNVFHPVAGDNTLVVTATGSVDVRNHVALTPQVTGRVISISPSLRVGGTFTAGEQLLVIDRRDFQLAADAAQADVATAESDLLLEQAKSDAARANYDLLHPGEEVPALVARVPQIAQAEARLEAARARLRVAALDLERTVFSLPFDGTVTRTSAEVGQLLSRGQSFGEVFARDAIEVVAPISADTLKRLDPTIGRRARVREPYGSFDAVVEKVSAELDDRTRFATLYLKVIGETPVPGTFVDVEIDGPVFADTFLLPEAAEQISNHVWVLADGKLRSVEARTFGRTADGWIVAAFDPQDGVVLGAVPGAQEGQDVLVATSDSSGVPATP